MSEASPRMDGVPAPGTLVGEKYLVGPTIASGGMGCLVKARQQPLDRDVAIKFVLANSGRSAKARLLREARALRTLTSDHVVRVFDLGLYQDAPYIVMELLSGVDLYDRVAQGGPLPVEEAVDCLIEAAVAVAEAHSVGIIHRDIKPANLFLARTRGRQLVKVLDFGISKIPEPDRDDDLQNTSEDTVLGTPHFMSPEQLRNPGKIDERTDVWSLAVTLFYLLTGELCFEGSTRREIVGAIFADDPLELREVRPELPEALASVLTKALHKRPEARTASVAALVDALLPFASERGRIAADQLPSDLDPTTTEPSSAKPSIRQATTEDGLASTLAPTDGEHTPEPSSHHTTAADERSWRAVAAGAAIVVLGATLAWMARDPARTAAPKEPKPIASSSAAQVTPDLAVDTPASATNATPAATVTASASASAETPPSARLPKPPVPKPRAAIFSASKRLPPATSGAPATPPSASASAPAVDIDGMPILR